MAPRVRAAGAGECVGEPVSEKDVIAKHQSGSLRAHVIGTDDVGLGEAFGLGLGCIGDREPPLIAAPEQLPIAAKVLRGRDDQDVADAGQH